MCNTPDILPKYTIYTHNTNPFKGTLSNCSVCVVQALPVIKGLLDKLRSSVKELEGEESADGIRQHYENTLAHITHTKANDSSLYADVEV